VDDVARSEVTATGDLRVPDVASPERPSLGDELGVASRREDRPVDAASSKKRAVRRVDDRIRILLRDVPLNELEDGLADLGSGKRTVNGHAHRQIKNFTRGICET
jgi:hypothetical protein